MLSRFGVVLQFAEQVIEAMETALLVEGCGWMADLRREGPTRRPQEGATVKPVALCVDRTLSGVSVVLVDAVPGSVCASSKNTDA